MDKTKAIKEFKEIKKYSDKASMRLAAEKWDEKWKILIAVLLSAQTRDETTIPVAENLFKEYNSPEKIAKADIYEIEDLIKKVNYHKTKAKNIKNLSNLIKKNNLPEEINELIKLPGVGRKTANVFLTEINKTHAIAVDTHVFRISRKMHWTNSKTPEKQEKELMNLFPKKYWNQINPTLVRFGKAYGTSRKNEDKILEKIKNLRI